MGRQKITIIGAGIAGLTTAIALKNIGIEAQLFEANATLKPLGAGLGLGINAMFGFKALGIYDDIVKQGRIVPKFTIYDRNKKSITSTDFDRYNVGNFTIHRAQLYETLLSKIDSSTIHLGKKIKRFETTSTGVKLFFEDDTLHESSYVIVADGIHSVVRQQLVPDAVPRYSGYTCWRSVISNQDLTINETSETWAANGRFGIVPLASDALYWFACINSIPNNPTLRAYKTDELAARFKNYHNPIPDIIRRTNDKDLLLHDVYDIAPIKRFAYGRIVLMGDAAHATTPNMGQGACQAIEDAAVIAQCMREHTDLEQAFNTFEKRRLERTRWITETSWNIGKIAQLENPLMIALRDAAFRLVPKSIGAKQLEKISKVDFRY